MVDLALRPRHIVSVHRPIEDQTDADFMAAYGALLGRPHYYAECLRRWPTMIVAAIEAVADAPAGGVLVHCSAGRDRTGLVVALVLELLEIDRMLILDDYERGVRAANSRLVSHPRAQEAALSNAKLRQSLDAARATLDDLLSGLDVGSYLRSGGMSDSSLERLSARLLED